MLSCPVHHYALGECPGCDADPLPLLEHFQTHPTPPEALPVVAYQLRRYVGLLARRHARMAAELRR